MRYVCKQHVCYVKNSSLFFNESWELDKKEQYMKCVFVFNSRMNECKYAM